MGNKRACNTTNSFTCLVAWGAIPTLLFISFFHEKPIGTLPSASPAQALPSQPPVTLLPSPPPELPPEERAPPAPAPSNRDVSSAGSRNTNSSVSSTSNASAVYQIISIERKYKRKKVVGLMKLEAIERGLAEARAAIQDASQSQNYTTPSGVEGTSFIPKGRVYRNPYAFYRSHMEMLKRFKVWTYKEGDPPLFHMGPLTNIYGIDGQFMDEMEGGMSRFVARNPDEAHAFFLPWSVVNVVQHLYLPVIVSYSRDPMYRVVLDYAHLIARRYPFWNRSLGADHFMLSCHDWAPDVIKANRELFKNLMRALCNANTSEGFRPETDISIPEINIPTNGQLGPPSLGVRPSMRRILASFAGREHGHVRKLLFEHWKEKDNDIQVHEKLPAHANYFQMLGQSRFCLCPSGYEVASPRIVEAVQAECVPVLISENYSFPFNDVLDWNEFSIHIPVARIPEIKTILKGVSTRRYLRLLRGVRSVKLHFTLNRPAKPFDMIHMILHSVWLRRLNVKLPPG